MPHRGVIKIGHESHELYKPTIDYLSSTYDKPYLFMTHR